MNLGKPSPPPGQSRTTQPLLFALPESGFEPDASAYRAILDRIRDGVYLVDLQKRVRFWNRSAEAITGYLSAEVVGEPCGGARLCHIDEGGQAMCTGDCPLDRVLGGGVAMEAHAFFRHRLGHRVPVAIETHPLHDRDGNLIGAVEIFREETAGGHHERIIEELSRLAMLDDTTRLPNRRFFDIQLDRRMAELHRFAWSFGVLMIDIDHFKRVNDEHGHLTGDEILQMVGRTLSGNCRVFDTVARWGGEEFAAIIANVGPNDLARVAEKFRVMVESGRHVTESGDTLAVTVSIGGAIAQPNQTSAELMKRADEMLYTAKHGGRNRVCV